MANVNFYIEQKQGQQEAQIYLYFRFKSQTVKMATGQKVNPAHWDAAKQRTKKSAGVMWAELNQYLTHIETTAYLIYKEQTFTCSKPTAMTIKAELLLRLGKTTDTTPQVPTFMQFAAQFISNAKTANASIYTLKKYRTTLNHIVTFQKQYGRVVDFDSIDHNFYHSFINYLTNTLQLQPNTVGLYIKTLKVFLNAATEQLPPGTVNTQHKSRYFKAPESPTDNIYLSEKELNLLSQLSLAIGSRLDRIRDVFVIGCYTGLRFADFVSITTKTRYLKNCLGTI